MSTKFRLKFRVPIYRRLIADYSSNKRTPISGLNNSNYAIVRKQCTFVLPPSYDHNFKLTAFAYIVSKFSGDLPNISLDDPDFYKSSLGDVLPALMISNLK